MRAVTEGAPLGRVGRGAVAYEVQVNGRPQGVVITMGSNGYIVSARPVGSSDKLAPM